ncbi:MAG TPA: GNAT family N-acetyltransferase [Anaerolineales bacterium]|nr:GNAT family N-acetyltransferase [Anaerolineales bacterium]
MHIRNADPADLAGLAEVDPIIEADPQRLADVAHAIVDRQAFVAADGSQLLGYALLHHRFFNNGFVELLVVHPARRRAGVGSALMRHARSECRTAKLFTSTNASNTPMQALLDRLGFRRCGAIDALDVGDPEWFYVSL